MITAFSPGTIIKAFSRLTISHATSNIDKEEHYSLDGLNSLIDSSDFYGI